MRAGAFIYAGMIFFAGLSSVSAQHVLYCEPTGDRYTLRTDLAGRVGEYFWMQSTHRKRPTGRGPHVTEEQYFDIYNARTKQVSTVPSYPVSDATLKEYLVAGDEYFDQLILLGVGKKTLLFLQRYQADGRPIDLGRIIDTLPFNESGNSFILVRSEDRQHLLLLGFQSITSYPPKLHTLLFDKDWNPVYKRVYKHPFITQPIIQDDFIGYPLEDFNSGPVKLANNGQWLMTSPSRTNTNFLLFHFNEMDTGMAYKEIQLPAGSSMEDVNLSLNNERGEAFAAVLSTYHYTVLKNVEVVHYSMDKRSFDFDSSYRFSTLMSGQVKDENMTRESFIAVPGSGFLLMKEYGRPYTELYEEENDFDEEVDPASLFIPTSSIPEKSARVPVLHDGYARYPSLGALGRDHVRGDLGLFYFPGQRPDSCWSAMLSKEQTTELNSTNLSYCVVPVNGRLFVLYNSFFRNEDQYGSTTVLDRQGDMLSDALSPMFWKFKTTLLFQQARQIATDELVIPYNTYGKNGFAVVKFEGD